MFNTPETDEKWSSNTEKDQSKGIAFFLNHPDMKKVLKTFP